MMVRRGRTRCSVDIQSLGEMVSFQIEAERRAKSGGMARRKLKTLRCSCGMNTRSYCDLCGAPRCSRCSGRVNVDGKRGRAHLRCAFLRTGLKGLRVALCQMGARRRVDDVQVHQR